MRVAETFKSIQGESSFAGLPCFFIRLAGCNLDCACCDTKFARIADSDTLELTIAELLDLAKSADAELVEVTGGEPLLQHETPELCDKLLKAGYTVLLETNGSIPISSVSREVHRIMDCKCPSSGEADSILYANFAELTKCDEVKFIISDRTDFDYALAIIAEHDFQQTGCCLLFSPANSAAEFESTITPAILAEWMIAEGIRGRLQLQLHKVIWPNEDRGR